jgi:hypothetical protein
MIFATWQSRMGFALDLHMLSDRETAFMRYWETAREKQRTVSSRLLNGLPVAILFSLPILLLVIAVYIFSPSWYTKISQSIGSAFIPVVLAVFLCILFFSFFRMQYKWEMNEQLYQELKYKEGETHSDFPGETDKT